MVAKISKRFAEIIYQVNTSKNISKEIYQYGLELIISTAINILILLIVSIYFGYFTEVLIFSSCFILLRISAGGFHARTHLSCLAFYFCILLIGLVSAEVIMYYDYSSVFIVIFLLMSIILIFKYAPMDSRNKPLTINEKKIYAKKSRSKIIVISTLIILGLVFKIEWIHYMLLCSLAVMIESLILLPKLNKNRGD